MSDHIIKFTEKEKEELFNQEIPVFCEARKVTFEELLIENPEIYNKHYRHVISPQQLKVKWEQIQIDQRIAKSKKAVSTILQV